ncbi:MAG: 1-deoxy-D-xylulose-5-phosphate reductoisomerase [Fidelibacterota bacterium]
MKRIAILGSTGSIGRNALRVVDGIEDYFDVLYLTAGRNVSLLAEQTIRYRPKRIAVADRDREEELRKLLRGIEVEILSGREGIIEIAGSGDCDLILNAIVGSAGLEPTVAALRGGTNVALSNKESMVMGGAIIDRILKERNLSIYPVDSEHSAIWQCLMGEDRDSIRRVILTASGGPFREWVDEDFEKITVEEALQHPRWKMGRKITVDSATLMNKGLEVIEAYWLFGIPISKIEIVIHPQSIIHSMVEFVDGSVKAQLGLPDMKIPIQFALTYPERREAGWEQINFASVENLSFEPPDFNKFKCLSLAYDAIKWGGTMPAVMNVANELAVHLFLEGEIKFTGIPELIEKAMEHHEPVKDPELRDIKSAEQWVFNFVGREYTLPDIIK